MKTYSLAALNTIAAPLNSPALTGVPTAPTAAAGTNTTQLATTAFASNQDLGVNQSWQDLTASRSVGITYTNTTGKPIFISLSLPQSVQNLYMSINGITQQIAGGTTGSSQVLARYIIPNGNTYSLLTSVTIIQWLELR
jgi:hypothetical protein